MTRARDVAARIETRIGYRSESWQEANEGVLEVFAIRNIIIYTVGFDVGTDSTIIDFMTGCATDADHAYLAATASELQQAFQEIATSITLLRLSK